MRFYITIGACNLSVWLVVFKSFHIVRYIFWGQVEVLSMVTGKPKTLAKLSGSKSDKTYICPKMQALPIMPKSLEVSTKRSRDGMWRWAENITSHHCTMGKLKNGVKSSQLWQIISLSILIQNFQNFAHSSLNSPITQINTNIENKYLKNLKKIQKTCWGCFLKSRLAFKKTSSKKKYFL